MIPKIIKRGTMYYADISPSVGSEQQGHRPVLILSNDTGNTHSPTVVVAAVTGRTKKPLPTHYLLPVGNGLAFKSQVLLEQIRTLDKSRLHGFIGRLNKTTMEGVDRALAVSVGLECDTRTQAEDEATTT
ncbi:MAG: type II toxin-antitoxin system PemK/MazF family toxin [Oscillospiraceae bacterium]|jgi:mRNA interferase MazF|nr:type II toxin-antitoxin system PemK/MazF family toxin [Oscillospiraceae bacterium]